MPDQRVRKLQAMPGLTKIETLDYVWLTNRAEAHNLHDLAKLTELAKKHRAALAKLGQLLQISTTEAPSISVAQATEPVERIGDLVIRYAEEKAAPVQRPKRFEKAWSAFFGKNRQE
jgi:hypothetical protein